MFRFISATDTLGSISCSGTRWLLTKRWRSNPEFRKSMNWFFHTTLHDFEFDVRWPVFIAYSYLLRRCYRVCIIRKCIQSLLPLTMSVFVLARWKSENNPFEITSIWKSENNPFEITSRLSVQSHMTPRP